MSRLSFRPRPVDIHKKLPIVKSVRDLDYEDGGVSRMVQHGHVSLDSENELVLPPPTRRDGGEIPTPQFIAVESYEKDYSQTFAQPPSYLRSRGARNEGGEFVEYDLDDEDEELLERLQSESKSLPAEKLEQMLYKLELLDHKVRERAQGIPSTLGIPMPVLLSRESAIETLRGQYARFAALASDVYDYWLEKREKWQKPVLRRLQPPPPVNDTNPFHVFRPREKIHRPHTRRMQRRENDVQSFDKLRQVRRNLEQAKALMLAVQKREEKKRELAECEGQIQRLQLKYKHEAKLEEDDALFNSILASYPPRKLGFTKRDEPHEDINDQAPYDYSTPILDNATMLERMEQLRRKRKRTRLPQQRGRPPRKAPVIESLDPVMLFTKPVDPRELAAVGIEMPPVPSSSSSNNAGAAGEGDAPPPAYQLRGRMGRGGRLIFDRWNPLTRTPIGSSKSLSPPLCSF